MKKTKQTYSTPEVETLVIRFEGNLLSNSPQWSKSANSPGEIEDEETDRIYGF